VKVLDIETFTKYVDFLAQEVTGVVRSETDQDAVERLHVELDNFRGRFNASQVPEALTTKFLTLYDVYHRSASESARATLIDGVVTVLSGVWFRETRKRNQLEVLRGLKTDLEALSMHSKLHYFP
jgi:hypothetical protein